MAATSKTTAAGLHAPLKPAACIANSVQSGSETTAATESPESPERVNIEFWQQTTAQALSPEPYLPSISLDENGKPPFYQECSDAIRYSGACIYTYIATLD